jgi:hypothetical protein
MNMLTDAIRDARTGILHRFESDCLTLTNNVDLLTSKESTINLTPEELRDMVEIVNDAKGSLFEFLCTFLVNAAITATMNEGENCSTWFVGQWHEVPYPQFLHLGYRSIHEPLLLVWGSDFKTLCLVLTCTTI